MSAVRQLREALELRFPDAMPIARGLAPAVATGVRELDAALPNGGLPRGCLTVWRGGAAASALLRSACVEAVRRGERAAWVDGAGVTVGDFWPRGVMMVRPRVGAVGRGQGRTAGHAPAPGRATALAPGRTTALAPGHAPAPGKRRRRLDTSFDTLNTPSTALRALAAAEELLRSGGFALVVVTGVPAGMEAELVRLSRVAREGGGAVVTVEQPSERSGAAVSAARLRVETWHRPEAHVWRTGVFGEPVELASMGVGARVTGTGWLRHVNLELPVLDHAYRLSLDPGLVDRRGVRTTVAQPRTADRVERAAAEVEAIPAVVEGAVERPLEHVVGHIVGGVQSIAADGLAGAGATGSGDAGSGAAPADRGARPGVGRRPWAGRATLRRTAARVPGRSRLG